MTEPDEDAQIEYFYREGHLQSLESELSDLYLSLKVMTETPELDLGDLVRLTAGMRHEATQVLGTLDRMRSLLATFAKPFDPYFS
jgi:hypothetical protein